MTEPRRDVAAGTPVCPRHPHRESWVRCQRCERPTCPQCQRPAAVGIQCVDCVRDGQRSVRQPRTVFGGAVRGGRPVATVTVVGTCLAVFGLQLVAPGVTSDFAYVPLLTAAEPWRLLTAAFLHSSSFLLHIAFNMVALWTVGGALEALLGRVRFVALYLISALAGSVGVFLLATPGFDGGWVRGVVGASGAVFGLFGAFVVVNRRLGQDSSPLIAMIALNGVLGFVVPGIAWQAHLGGLIGGAACAAVLAYAPRERRELWHAGGLAAVALVLVAALTLKAATVPGLFLPVI